MLTAATPSSTLLPYPAMRLKAPHNGFSRSTHAFTQTNHEQPLRRAPKPHLEVTSLATLWSCEEQGTRDPSRE
jgi:hypothetical protein